MSSHDRMESFYQAMNEEAMARNQEEELNAGWPEIDFSRAVEMVVARGFKVVPVGYAVIKKEIN